MTLISLVDKNYFFLKSTTSDKQFSPSLVLEDGGMMNAGSYMLVVDVRWKEEVHKEVLLSIKTKANITLSKLSIQQGFINLKKAFTDHTHS